MKFRIYWRGLICFFLGHRLVWPQTGGAYCTRCGGATDWEAWLNGGGHL